MNKKVVIPLSGGLDSSVLLYSAAEQFNEVHAITFNYNQQHATEITYASIQIENAQRKFPKCKIYHTILDLSFISDIAKSELTGYGAVSETQPASYVPFRNLMMISIAASYAESNDIGTIWYGATGDDSINNYWDCSSSFVSTVNTLLNLNERKIVLDAPFGHMYKSNIISQGIYSGVDFKETYTCYSGEDVPTVKSASSKIRIRGFISNGYKDPVQYQEQETLNVLYDIFDCKDLK